ncbi:cellulose binding domain-containing protein [Roseateles sp. SL47]|uniref:glycoside hydrolase family 48 protein n=1 Tax=Roseateles sp. SL47 TaxID=2995138 RepID=UPI00226EC376|nr:glycoside hydrolase family 48 protein [Roseateles sp. SL47]WAC75684.1 cellulose binding domain-containing protein [Roseateles sp. SL47]
MFRFTRKAARATLLSAALALAFGAHAQTDYNQRFLVQYNKIKNPANGYFSPEGVPYHSVETLMVEAPDYGHETTSEAYSFWIWLEAQYGRVTGDWAPLNAAWANMEKYIIPSSKDQPTNSFYNASKPASYAGEYALPKNYPSPLEFNTPVGQDPIGNELASTYGNRDIYGMHWLIDVDNWYGYGWCGDGVTKPSYINTFQRGAQESVWETVPHPSCETFKWGRSGGTQGFLSLFTGDSNYAKQWRYTNAPDADGRAIQAIYWANLWATEQGKGAQVADLVKKAAKMGDFLRYAMFDKYFKRIGNCVGSTTCPGGTGAADSNGLRDNQHYLMSWYYAWGGALDSSAGWAWRIGSSHNHFGYQNPMAAWALSTQQAFKPLSPSAAGDWGKSFQRQMEFYRWLQSADGAIAGGATNSWNGNHEQPPTGTPTFYGMFYDEAPVYHDPASNTWFGFQVWSMQRVAELYYASNDPQAKALLDKWVPWAIANTRLLPDGTYEIPSTLQWSGKPDTWNSASPGSNATLRVTVTEFTNDVGTAAAYARTLSYYAAKAGNAAAKDTARELLDRMWNKYQDAKGLAVAEKRKDYLRFDDPYNATTGDGVYVPSGWTGTNAQGAVIDSNATFLSIRPKYQQDPDWAKLSAYLAGGAEPSWIYHRFWAQADIALAQADYGRLFPATGPSIVVSSSTLTVPEEGSASFGVSLSEKPSANVTVAVAKAAGGDVDLATATPSLVFTPDNYATPQTVTVTAARDADAINGSATFALSATGLNGASVLATEQDSDIVVPVELVVSSAAVSVPETGTQTFTVKLASAPTGTVSVAVARTAGDTDISVSAGASLSFTPTNWNTPQTVTLAAAKDADSLNGVATISISAANAATRTVTATEIDNDVKTCAVVFDTSNDWGSGQVPSIKLSNLGSTPLSNWSISFTESNAFTLSNSWSGTFSVNGRTITITPVAWNGTIAPNSSVELGMQISYSGAKPVPTGLAWAGQSCDITVK